MRGCRMIDKYIANMDQIKAVAYCDMSAKSGAMSSTIAGEPTKPSRAWNVDIQCIFLVD